MDVLGSVADFAGVLFFLVYLYLCIGHFYGTVCLLINEINGLMKNGDGCLSNICL